MSVSSPSSGSSARPWAALAVLGALGLPAAAAPQPQSSQVFGVEAEFALVSSREVVPPEALGQPRGITASVPGRFGPDGISDIAFVADGELRVAMNPGEWDLSFAVASDIRGVVAHAEASPGRDGLISFGAGGVFLRRWSDSEPRGFRSHKLSGPWLDPSLVAAESLRVGGLPVLTWVAVYDAGRGTIDTFVVTASGDPDVPPSLASAGLPLPLSVAPQALGLLEYDGSLTIAVATAGGLHLFDLLGQPLEVFGGSQSTCFLRGFDHDPSSGLPQQLAWVRRSTDSSNFLFAAVNDVFVAAPDDLGATPVTGLAVGQAATASDLFLNFEDGTLLLMGTTCADYSPQSDCALPFPPVAAPPWTWQAPAVSADFEIDGFPDLLLFEDAEGEALIYARVPALPVPEAASPGAGGISVDGWTPGQPSAPPEATLTLQLDQAKLSQRLADLPGVSSLDAQLIVYAWNTYDFDALEENELQTETAAEGWHTGWSLGDPAPVFVLPLVLEETPDLLAVELRVFDDQGTPVDVAAFSITRSCPIFADLLSELGLDGDDFEWPQCASPPPPSSPPIGISLGPGVLPLPSLPPFVDDVPPDIRLLIPPH